MSNDRILQQLDRIEDKITVVDQRINSIDITLAAQHSQLVEHIKRTAILERELKPVNKHVQQMQGAGKLLGLLALIASIVAGFAVLWSR